MPDVVLIDAVRTPIGRRNGGLSGMHSIDLLGVVLRALVERTGIDPSVVGQLVGGCVGQVGMQASNITRTAWLAAGLPRDVPGSTVESQCGSSQQATNLAYALVAGGVVDVAVGCGVESMSRVPMGSTIPKDPDVGKPVNRSYWRYHEYTNQYEAAERIAEKWSLTRSDCDEFGVLSQRRAADAWAAGRFDTQVVAADGVERDEGLRETTLEGLAGLRPTGRPDGVHTAATSSQIADGAGAVLLMTRERAAALGLEPLAEVVDTCLVGCDPVLMLEGPIPATAKLLGENGLTIDDIDVFEINEAFASVVLAWERETKADLERVNPNGGAIALGHPLGGTGAILLTKAVHELVRTGGRHALVSMCCGGGLGTGTLLRRA